MKNSFQTVLIGIFLAFFVFAVLIFSGLLPIGEKNKKTTSIVGKVVVWGTFNEGQVRDILENLGTENKELDVVYFKQNEDTYESDLLSAFAKGEAPDLFFVSNKTLFKNKSFVYQIPYTSYSKRTYQDTFIDGADIFLDDQGINALPVLVDPLMVFYNKSLLSNAGISTPPVYWDELFELNDKLTKRRSDGTITQSMVALGAYENINNAKDIISMLFIQSGNNIVKMEKGEAFTDFNKEVGTATFINTELVKFFMEFSNPLGSTYSWNKGLINSKDLFTGNNLAFYIGHASELFEIQEINPNLSFDVAEMFQIRNEKNKKTSGDIYAIAINKNSTNLTGALGVAYNLSSEKYTDLFSQTFSLPPVLKKSLLENPTDPYLYSFFKTTISLKTWLDPNENITDEIFSKFINDVVSGRVSIIDSLNRLESEIDLLLNRKI